MRLGKVWSWSAVLGISFLGISSLSFSYINYGPIKAGDSLWKIASTHRVPHVSTQKMVHAIQVLNPSMKKLKLGGSLKLPSTIQEVDSALGAVPAEGGIPAANPAPMLTSSSAAAVSATSINASSNSKMSDLGSSSTSSVNPQLAISPKTVGITNSNSSTQLIPPATLATQKESTSTKIILGSSAVVTPASTLNPRPTMDSGTSFWAWLWFLGLVIVLGLAWKNRSKWFAHLRGGKEIAARRLGLNRTEHEQAFDTNPLWTKGKPSYAQSEIKEGDFMAEAMIQMAEGEYSEAKQTLLEGIEKDPKNIDFRMKLLEVSVALDDRELFKRESDYLLENLMDQADPRWGKIKTMYLRKWAYDPS